jgi:hypothetical protein
MGSCMSNKDTININGINIKPDLYFKNVSMWNATKQCYDSDSYDIFIFKINKRNSHSSQSSQVNLNQADQNQVSQLNQTNQVDQLITNKPNSRKNSRTIQQSRQNSKRNSLVDKKVTIFV